MCQSARLDLATLAITSIGSVPLPGVKRVEVQQERWLSCDAVDAIVKETIFSGDPRSGQAVGFRLYAVRVLPDTRP